MLLLLLQRNKMNEKSFVLKHTISHLSLHVLFADAETAFPSGRRQFPTRRRDQQFLGKRRQSVVVAEVVLAPPGCSSGGSRRRLKPQSWRAGEIGEPRARYRLRLLDGRSDARTHRFRPPTKLRRRRILHRITSVWDL